MPTRAAKAAVPASALLEVADAAGDRRTAAPAGRWGDSIASAIATPSFALRMSGMLMLVRFCNVAKLVLIVATLVLSVPTLV